MRPVVAIIGCGPRGLSALESLFAEAAAAGVPVKALLFERSGYMGAGWIYDPEQVDGNWLNVSARAVGIWPRAEIDFGDFRIPRFPTFQEWWGLAENTNPEQADVFPLRSTMGRYLNERYKSIAGPLERKGLLEVVRGEVVRVHPGADPIGIEMKSGKVYQAGEAVLTIGHQPTAPDTQLASWLSRMEGSGPRAFADTYPIENILESGVVRPGAHIGIRGFGLAMIDVARSLSQEKGGRFEVADASTRQMVYKPGGGEVGMLVPFSLDGLPMAPKPLNQKLDTLYQPNSRQLEAYKFAVEAALSGADTPSSPGFLIRAITPVVREIFTAAALDARAHDLTDAELERVIGGWLEDEAFEHPLIVPRNLRAEATLQLFIRMATGHEKISLDYCIGHVWRHCQPTMYQLLSFAPLPDACIAAIVDLDERMKRYAYGPPVDSLQQLLALVRAGKLSLDFVADPEIESIEEGWRLSKGGESIVVHTMVNSVLDAPKIKEVTAPLPNGLLQEPGIEALHNDLGIRTAEDGQVEFSNGRTHYRLSILGRLAKGTLIGVDAISQCFGPRSEIWARGVIGRILQQGDAR